MRVYVFGLGHIGLPMATWISLHDHQVIGIDINPNVITQIQDGTVKIEEYYQGQHISQITLSQIEKKTLSVRTEFIRVNDEPSVFVIAVGIANKGDGVQDISPIISVLETITPSLLSSDLLLFRTTLIPGTIDQIIIPWFEKLSVPIRLAYCPETIMETRAFEELENNPMILAGINEESLTAAEFFLRSLAKGPIYHASTIRTSEMVKVIQNIHRDVNIALINEISDVAYYLNVDIYELIFLANTHPRVKLLQPGPGVGGYCLPNAFSYLQKAVEEKKCPLTLMSIARKLNSERPQKIVELVRNVLHDAGKVLANSTIALIGLAMKDYCADCRYSPAIEIASLLINHGAKVQAYDPMVAVTNSFQVTSIQECLNNADCLVLAANQEGIIFDLEQIESLMSKPILVIDTRNTFPDFPGIKVYKL